MKKFRFTALALIFVLLISVFAACVNEADDDSSTTSTEATDNTDSSDIINIAVLKGPTGMGAARLMSQNNNNESKAKYDFSIEGAPDVVVSDLLSGKLDIAAIPTTSAATLYNRTEGKIKILGISTLSVLYIVEKGESIKNVSDLAGKTIYSAGKGTNVEYVMTYILEQNDLVVGEDVTIEFVSEHAEAVAQAKAGNADIVLLPEPFVTQLMMANEGFTKALDFKEEWAKVSDFELPMGVIATTKDFAENNSELIAKFFEDYTESVTYINDENNFADGAKLIGDFEIMPEQVAQFAIPFSNIVFINGEEMKETVSDFFEKMHSANPEIIGGAIPADDIFHIQ